MARNKGKFEGWKTKAEAAIMIGISERTLERMVQRGQIHQAYKHIPGRRPIAVLNPIDLKRVRKETVGAVPAPSQVGTSPSPHENGGQGESSTALTRHPPSAVLDFLSYLESARQQPVPVERKLFLTLKESSEYAGLPLAYLRRLISEGKLKALRTGGYRIRRSDLEEI